MGKNPRAYKSEKRNREVAQQKKREAKRLQRLGKPREDGEADGTLGEGAVTDGIEPAVAVAGDKETDGQ